LKNWYAVFTKPRSEDNVANLLSLAGIETLSPKIAQKKFFGMRIAETVEALFPCYIFAQLDPYCGFRMVKYTRGVRYIVGGHDPAPVSDEIIETIRMRMAGGVIRIEPEPLRVGDEVVINAGPLKGFYGIFARYTRASERALILLKTINSRLEIESWQISGGVPAA